MQKESLIKEYSGECVINREGAFFSGKQLWRNIHPTAEEAFRALYATLDIRYPKFGKMDGLCRLGFLAAELLVANYPPIRHYAPFDTGVVLSNRSSSLHTDRLYWETTRNIPSPSLFVYTLPNVVNAEICIRHGFKGESHFMVNEACDPDLLQQAIDRLFASTPLKACLAGWVELCGNNYEARLFIATKID